jgi:hypothetical protein
VLINYSNAYEFDVPAGQWNPKTPLPTVGDECVVLLDDDGDAWMPVYRP